MGDLTCERMRGSLFAFGQKDKGQLGDGTISAAGVYVPAQPAQVTLVALGLKWRNVGATKPSQGLELEHHELHMALYNKTEFTQQEWDDFGVTNLRMDHFVNRSGYYFK